MENGIDVVNQICAQESTINALFILFWLDMQSCSLLYLFYDSWHEVIHAQSNVVVDKHWEQIGSATGINIFVSWQSRDIGKTPLGISDSSTLFAYAEHQVFLIHHGTLDKRARVCNYVFM